eukprot:Skav209508  [mRNA]  locus=scaffold2767:159351:163990:+ [translate_table: standard]
MGEMRRFFSVAALKLHLKLDLLSKSEEIAVNGLYVPLLGAILRNAIDQGRHWGDRGASLDSDLAAQARALRAAVEGPGVPVARYGSPLREPVTGACYGMADTTVADQDPAGWFAFFDEDGSGYLERQLLEKVLPAVVPVDATKLEAGPKAIQGLRESLCRIAMHFGCPKLAQPATQKGRIMENFFQKNRVRWLAEHLEELQEEREKGPLDPEIRDLIQEVCEGWPESQRCGAGLEADLP